MTKHTEQWKPVVGHEGWYDVSTLGRVRRVRGGKGAHVGQCITPKIQSGGYHMMRLCIGAGRTTHPLLHRLVMEAFVGPRPKGLHINHKDGNKLNNSLGNLEYATISQNILHRIHVLGVVPATGEDSPHAKLTNADIRAIRKARGYQHEIAERFGICRPLVSMIRSGRRWAHVV